jgi:hypothetical protein
MTECIDSVESYGNLSTEFRNSSDGDEMGIKSDNRSDQKNVRKMICRYGRGCTHLTDSLHSEQFWHPPFSHCYGKQVFIAI